MADVAFGFVYDFGPARAVVGVAGPAAPGWTAPRSIRRSASAARATVGLRCSGSSPPIRAGSRPRSTPWWTAPTACARSGRSPRPLCQVAAARFDGMVSLRRSRGVDAAAGQLIVREAGGLVSFPGCEGPLSAPLDRRADLAGGRRPVERDARRAREDPGLIDWIIARANRHASSVAPATPRRPPPTWPRWPPSPRRRVVAYTGLQPARPLPPPEGISRREWVASNIDSMRLLLDPVLKRATDKPGHAQAGDARSGWASC